MAYAITGKKVGGECHAAVGSEATEAVLPPGRAAADVSVTSPLVQGSCRRVASCPSLEESCRISLDLKGNGEEDTAPY